MEKPSLRQLLDQELARRARSPVHSLSSGGSGLADWLVDIAIYTTGRDDDLCVMLSEFNRREWKLCLP